MSKSRGITLIALVVTIIIILILAGVAMVMFNGNGIFAKAQLGGEKYDAAQKEENTTIGSLMDGYDREEEKIKLLPPKIEIVGEKQDIYTGNVQIKLTTVNPNVIKESHYFIEGATAKGDTKFKNEDTITVSASGKTTIKAYSVSWNDEKTENSELSITISYGPPAEANVEIIGETEVASIPLTLRANVTNTSQNGITLENCKYTINSSAENLGTNVNKYDQSFVSTKGKNDNTASIEIPIKDAGTKYLHILTVDDAGEKIETIKPISVIEERHTHSGDESKEGGCYTKKGYIANLTTEKYHAAVEEQSHICGAPTTWEETGRMLFVFASGVVKCSADSSHDVTHTKISISLVNSILNGNNTCTAKVIDVPAKAAYWEDLGTEKVSGEGDMPSDSNDGETKKTYKKVSDKWYLGCGKEENQLIGYSIVY